MVLQARERVLSRAAETPVHRLPSILSGNDG
jgi:hypothetical protein